MMATRAAATEQRAHLRRYRSPRDGRWHVQLTLGDTYVTSDSGEVLTTILGSCIAACIRDPVSGVGGMNHFLLPDSDGHDREARCYGINAMELLINEIQKHGGDRRRLEAKLFGGGNVVAALSDVGARNVSFAKQFLADEGIALVGGDVGGNIARRIQYMPATGKALQAAVRDRSRDLVEDELSALHTVASPAPASDVEFFE
ncbi:MAG: chemotaxis protein CheD [Alphaproteobacteria bacterium]|nr:chemotaxis protein CheD [Alphaproteobacteria bacterium]